MKKTFLDYFKEISSVPRGSGHNKLISDYLVDFAKEHALYYEQDESLNVIIKKDKHPSFNGNDTYIIQGHMDMVCEKEENNPHDFTKEGLELYEEDGFIKAKGTTLGADDGICLAYALALLDDDETVLPAITALFTTDEETGMYGAKALNLSSLEGNKVINVDSEKEGIITLGCAGGIIANISKKCTPKLIDKDKYTPLKIRISGLKGGHSGEKIGDNRENAIRLMFRVIMSLRKECEKDSITPMFGKIIGGNKSNVIPNECMALLYVGKEETEKFSEIFEQVCKEISKQLSVTEPMFKWELSESNADYKVVNESDFNDICDYMTISPEAVVSRTPEMIKFVESSLNHGIFVMDAEKTDMVILIRSSVTHKKNEIVSVLKTCAKRCNMDISTDSDYPAWEYKKDSKLREIAVKAYKKMYNTMPVLEIIHAGVECGILLEKRPDFDIISIGPDIHDIHTVNEKLDIKSAERVYEYIKEILMES